MCSQLNSLSTFMGLPDSSPIFLSQKDTQFAMENECNFLVRPSLELQDACQIAPSENQRVSERDQRELSQQGQEQDRNDQVLLEVSSSLKVKLPSVRDGKEGDKEEDAGCKTPTSMDQKIPVLVCPSPPRKPKALPSTNKKGSRRRVFLDLSDEIESLFPPALLADFGNKIKKVRKESFII